MLAITCVVVFAALTLVLCVLHVMKPRKLKITVKLLPVPTFSLEADSGDGPKALPRTPADGEGAA